MRQVLLAAVRVEAVIHEWRVDVGVHGALTNTSTVWSTLAVVELVRPELSMLVVLEGIRSVRRRIRQVGVAVERIAKLLSRRKSRSKVRGTCRRPV